MNTAIRHDSQLAEKLKSLSLQAGTFEQEPPKRRARWLLVGISVLALAAASILVALAVYQPGVLAPAAGAATPADGNPTVPAPSGPNGTSSEAPRSLAGAASAARDVTGSGYVIAPDFAAVFSKYEGRIIEVAVEVGDKVEAGQLLVKLDDAGARFNLRQAGIAKISAELALAAKDIDLSQASSSLERLKILVARGAASKQQLDDAETLRQRATNSVAQAGQELAKAKLDLEKAEELVSELAVRAPIAGIVSVLNARVGESVLARADSVREAAGLLTITSTANMVIDADVAESSIALMRPGLGGEAVLDGFPDQPFKVEISRIAPAASAEKGTISLRLSLVSPPAGIRPNMAARISIAASTTVAATDQRGMEQ